VNYIAFPIVDIKTKKVGEILYFIDTELQKRRKELSELDRDSYLGFLEHDYANRSISDHSGEIGHFGVGALPEMDAAEVSGGTLSAEQITQILEDK